MEAGNIETRIFNENENYQIILTSILLFTKVGSRADAEKMTDAMSLDGAVDAIIGGILHNRFLLPDFPVFQTMSHSRRHTRAILVSVTSNVSPMNVYSAAH